MTITREPYKAFAERVDGLILPAPVGSHPALDFCNTEAGWGTPEPGDYLRSYEYVVAWAKGAGLVEHDLSDRIRRRASRNHAEASRALEEARAFRNSLHTVVLKPRPGADWDRVAALVGEAAASAVLKPGAHTATWELPERIGMRLPLLALARSAGELLASDEVASVRPCPGNHCGWLFLDRKGSRRWCTMSTCGNRAKARRFAQRQRSRPGIAH
jgi:predicted RNA-binding Zn ribbon-like protein